MNCSSFSRKTKKNCIKEKGITLIALVITIVILIILATITINMAFGDNGLVKYAEAARDMTEEAAEEEATTLDEYSNTLNKWINEGTTAGSIPEGLEIGSTVSYNPSGTYVWQSKYCSSPENTSYQKTLNSGDDQPFNINTWKVFEIDEANGEITLVPDHSTYNRENGTVTISGAQGYNNAVYLLNEACSKLYGNDAKGIKARSINIGDIEGKMLGEALTQAHSDSNYGKQASNAYIQAYSYYPSIYAQEALRSIDDNGKVTLDGLEINEQPKSGLIEATDNNATNGYSQGNSIQPTQTYWSKDNSFMKMAFETASNKTSYYDLLMPDDIDTGYWLASRCVSDRSGRCLFTVSRVLEGNIDAIDIFGSNSNPNVDSNGLFPVVSLSSKLISGDVVHGFVVE